MKIRAIIIMGLFFILIRIFVIDIVIVSSGSMEGTLQVGDILLSNRMFKYQLPKSISYYDNIIFKSPDNNFEQIVKSCVGLSGDTITISDNIIQINGEIITNTPKGVCFVYKFKTTLPENTVFKKFEHWCICNDINMNQFYKSVTINQNQLISLQNNNLNTFIEPVIDTIFCNSEKIIQGSIKRNWNYCNIGPIVIPKKGLVLKIDSNNYSLYSKIIREEGNDITRASNNIIINSIIESSYTFKNNYYFFIGDNRFDSYDSRFYGFISENNILGKVIAKI